MKTNVPAECMGSRCDQWARPDTLLPAEPFVEDAAVAEPLIGSGYGAGIFPQEMIADSWILVIFAPSTLSLTLFILYYLHLVAKRDAFFDVFANGAMQRCNFTKGAIAPWSASADATVMAALIVTGQREPNVASFPLPSHFVLIKYFAAGDEKNANSRLLEWFATTAGEKITSFQTYCYS